jgi:hypothetical protein
MPGIGIRRGPRGNAGVPGGGWTAGAGRVAGAGGVAGGALGWARKLLKSNASKAANAITSNAFLFIIIMIGLICCFEFVVI